MASGSNSFLGDLRSRLPRKRPHSNSDPPDPSTHNNPGSSGGTNSRSNDAVKALKSALEILQGGLQVFLPLKSAVDELVECTAHLQIADRNIHEYQRLAADLANLAHSLQARLSQSKPTHTPFSVQNVARAIKELAQHIQLQRDRSRTRRFHQKKTSDVIALFSETTSKLVDEPRKHSKFNPFQEFTSNMSYLVGFSCITPKLVVKEPDIHGLGAGHLAGCCFRHCYITNMSL